MTEDVSPTRFDEQITLDEAVRPPLDNGRIVLDEPWQGRVFAMARALCEAGHCTWDDFRACLIARIARWETLERDEPYMYYERFVEALEDLLRARGLVDEAAMRSLAEALAARPIGHDHPHDHH